MAGILSGLTGVQPPASAPAPEPPAAAAPTPIPEQVQLVMRGLSSGQIPGAYVPAGAKPVESGLKPEDLFSAGIAIYKPNSKGITAVAFNPGVISEKTLEALDKAGKIPENFPNLVNLLQGAEQPEETPLEGLTPPMDSEGNPNDARRSQVLPRPTPAAQTASLKALNGLVENEPSKRQLPGAGSVLNGLVARPV